MFRRYFFDRTAGRQDFERSDPKPFVRGLFGLGLPLAIVVFGFTLCSAFVHCHSKLVRRYGLTAIDVASKLPPNIRLPINPAPVPQTVRPVFAARRDWPSTLLFPWRSLLGRRNAFPYNEMLPTASANLPNLLRVACRGAFSSPRPPSRPQYAKFLGGVSHKSPTSLPRSGSHARACLRLV